MTDPNSCLGCDDPEEVNVNCHRGYCRWRRIGHSCVKHPWMRWTPTTHSPDLLAVAEILLAIAIGVGLIGWVVSAVVDRTPPEAPQGVRVGP